MISMLIYDSADFMNEVPGNRNVQSVCAFTQCNGIIEQFHRTLEEQVLQVEAFTSFEKAHYGV
ncbi:hypothetical protein ING2E5B_0515 [Fermentimonas caenicola]|uniref:Integrase catalytic domain-containing protein n=1 Tax=Fermentimonas caenicola TaxID=1562970 RepID=A0A098C036_9BACT|nr:hypothetical protein ING2E5B_0515 [Fermentimonas caenicola]